MYTGKSLKPLINFYPSIYYNLTKEVIPNFTEIFNLHMNKSKQNDLNYLNFKHEYIYNYNPDIKTSVQFNYDLKKSNSYTSISEIKDKSTNAYLYEYIHIYKRENNYMIHNEFELNGVTKNLTNIKINKSADISLIFNNIAKLNFSIIAYSDSRGLEQILYKMITLTDFNKYYQSINKKQSVQSTNSINTNEHSQDI